MTITSGGDLLIGAEEVDFSCLASFFFAQRTCSFQSPVIMSHLLSLFYRPASAHISGGSRIS